MPIFEYRCTDCQHQFSRLQLGASAPSELRCPKCESERVERLMSSFASSSSRGASGGCGFGPPAGGCGSGFS